MAIKKQTPCVNDTVLELAEQAVNGDVLIYAEDAYSWTVRSEAWTDLTMLTKTERGFEFIDKNGRSRGIVNLGEPYHGVDETPSCQGCAKDYIYQNAVTCLQALCCDQTAYVGNCNALGEGWSVDWCEFPAIPPEPSFDIDIKVELVPWEEVEADPELWAAVKAQIGHPNAAFKAKTFEQFKATTQFDVTDERGISQTLLDTFKASSTSGGDWYPTIVRFKNGKKAVDKLTEKGAPNDLIVVQMISTIFSADRDEYTVAVSQQDSMNFQTISAYSQYAYKKGDDFYISIVLFLVRNTIDTERPYFGEGYQLLHQELPQRDKDIINSLGLTLAPLTNKGMASFSRSGISDAVIPPNLFPS